MSEYLKTFYHNLPAETKALLLFGILLVCAMLSAWYDKGYTPAAVATASAPVAGTDLPKTDVPVQGGTVKVLPKKKVADKIPLPPEVIKNPVIEITQTAQVPPSENGSKVVATINTQSGESSIYSVENPAPLFAFENKRRIGIGYGVGGNGTVAKLFGEYTFLRVGNIHAGVQGEIVTETTKSPDAKAMAVIDYRW